ncbi:activating signal cointegrator 1 complex subunit 3-like isoform X2 [Bolinopsis microptera]
MSLLVGESCSTDHLKTTLEEMFTLFLGFEEFTWREVFKIKDKFGHVDEDILKKVHSSYTTLSEALPEYFTVDHQNGDNIPPTLFGAKIKFNSPEVVKFSHPTSDGESEDEEEVGGGAGVLEATANVTKQITSKQSGSRNGAVVRRQLTPDSPGWLTITCSELYKKPDPPALSQEELISALYNHISSQNSNEQLQDMMFGLLGFEAFDLIAEILAHRRVIKEPSGFDLLTDEPNFDIYSGEAENAPKIPHFKTDRGPALSKQVNILTEREKIWMKQVRKEEKKMKKEAIAQQRAFDPELLREQREYALMTANMMPALQPRLSEHPELPYVFDTRVTVKQTAAYILGAKITLPVDVVNDSKPGYEEYTFPATKHVPPEWTDKLVDISELDDVGRIAFKGIKKLNRIQSVVFDTAYNTNENLLISAPTGAGKTNVALLTVLKLIKNFMENGVVQRNKFKVVYITPMKALAAEMTKTFGKKLQGLGIQVRELTGDMQLTKQEIAQTQMLIVTPEKWDVVTRKSTGDTALSQLVRLLIIDEVHLLHEDRGSVIETLIARTLRQVETTQQMIRIVGLSATLPNYIDVANFLKVNLHKGLFYFDSRFRPVPLKQTFIGVRGTNKFKTRENIDQACYEKVLESVKQGNQVLVFVHSRNGTLKTAEKMRELAQTEGELELFSPAEHPKYQYGLKQLARSSQKKLNYLYRDGFTVHHAGLPRSDRNVVEALFSEGLVRVMCCTATLAWGVNLPAHTVVIKGTEYYNAGKGEFVDIGILDVLQIFGRAGRPQFDSSGHGIIITPQDKLHKYLMLLTQQHPIESQFIKSLEDNLNAEICLGTVGSVEEAIQWMKYTYLWVRMQKNPLLYGINQKMRERDPDLHHYLTDLIKKSALVLDKCRMIRFNPQTELLAATDLGRTASHFYIKHPTIEHFNSTFKPNLLEAEILGCISQADEFAQLKVQEEESVELGELHHSQRFEVKGGTENVYGKVNILLQAYISQLHIESYSLLSDSLYVAQNGKRIIRAMFDIAVHNGYPSVASKLLNLSKMLNHRIWEGDTPLRQFNILPSHVLDRIERLSLDMHKLKEMPAREIGHMLQHVAMGDKIKACVNHFPAVALDAVVQPVTATVLKIELTITPQFHWNDKWHGKMSEPWWVWVEDTNNDHMYHSEYFSLQKKHVVENSPQKLNFSIPLIDKDNMSYIVRMISDNWIGAEGMECISVKGVILPQDHLPHTQLLDLQPIPTSIIPYPEYKDYFSFSHFNPVQTQIFHSLFHTDHNILVGAPTGSGKTVAAELAMFRVFINFPGDKCVYIAPLKALVKERMKDWSVKIGKNLGKKLVELTGDVVPDMKAVVAADVIVTTPEKWDGISRSWQNRKYVQKVRLIVIDEIHLLGNDRGPVLEVIVSRTNFISSHTEQQVRVVGLSTALANAGDVGSWLNISNVGMFNFKPSVRPVPLEVHITGFPGQHYCPRMATMNKPAYNDIKQHSPEKPVLIFVASRRQTRLTAYDLISHAAAQDPKQWIHDISDIELQALIEGVADSNLKHTLQFGIGLHHAGLHEKDRRIVEHLFTERKIQILVATATLAWGVNLPAHLVIIKGTEFYDGKSNRYVDFPITDVLQMMGRAGRPQFDDQGIACIYVHDIKKHFYKKFLYEPFPVESNLLGVLTEHFNAEIVAGTVKSKQDAMDYLTWTYFFRRLLKNPAYYHLEDLEDANINTFLSSIVSGKINELEQAYCVAVDVDGSTLLPQILGYIASYYYLSHKTVKMFADTLNPATSVNETLQLLCDVTEYDEMPVRHNEDKINEEMATSLPIRVPSFSYDSPHTKVHLLLQAHFTRTAMPMTDYITDLKSVHDQAIRILQAMLDVAADSGWLKTSLSIMHIVKMVIQGCWMKDDPLLQLPHVEPHQLHLFYQLQSLSGSVSFPEILLAYSNRQDLLRKNLESDFNERELNQIHKAMVHMPLLRVTHSITGSKILDKNFIPKEAPGGAKWVPVHADKEYSIEVKLNLPRSGKYSQNKSGKSGRKAHAPRFNKPVDETWWVLMGEIESGELIAMKRCGPFRGNTLSVPLSFYTPETPGSHIYTFYVISQTYLGLDQQYPVYLEVLESEIVYQMDADMLDEEEEEYYDKMPDDYNSTPSFVTTGPVNSFMKTAPGPPGFEDDSSKSVPPGFSSSQDLPPGLPPPPPGLSRRRETAWKSENPQQENSERSTRDEQDEYSDDEGWDGTVEAWS